MNRLMVKVTLLALLVGAPILLADIMVKVRATNPFEEPLETEVKVPLPDGVLPEHVTENPDDMEIRYEDDADRYFMVKQVTLEPEESRLYQVAIKDIWNIPAEQLAQLVESAGNLAQKLEGTEYETVAGDLARRVQTQVQEIREAQDRAELGKVKPERHITAYHTNKAQLQRVREDVATLEKYLAIASDTSVIEHTPRGVPDIGTIWKVIFIMLAFVGVVSLVSFLIWSGQLKKVRTAAQLNQEEDM